jgi:hypothetical protein
LQASKVAFGKTQKAIPNGGTDKLLAGGETTERNSFKCIRLG